MNCFVFLTVRVEKLQCEVGDKEKILNSLLGNLIWLLIENRLVTVTRSSR